MDNKIKDLAELLAEIIGTKGVSNSIENSPIIFSGDMLDGKGMLWSGNGYTKQFIFSSSPDKFFSSETIDLAKGKSISINNLPVLSEQSLGNSVTKSNLKEVGRLKGLIVDGSAILAEYFYFDSSTNRLGIGTEAPKKTLDIVENNVEILIGEADTNIGFIGTFNSQDFQIHTDSISRITVSAGGNITLGNNNFGPTHVNVLGKLTVNVNTPDNRAALHVNGAIKYNGKLHMSNTSAPSGGSYIEGDICWNSEPNPGGHVGWICVRAGNPGLWHPFGRID